MSHALSLAYLGAHRCTPAQAVAVAAQAGYQFVGLRLWPNGAGAPCQRLIGEPALLRETQAVMQDTGVGVLDLEIIRLDADFDPHRWDALYDIGAALGAKAVLVAGDDTDEARLTASYACLCEALHPFGITADLEFMPWTAVPDARSAQRIVRNAGQPANAGILVDALHFGRSTSALEDIRALPTELLHYAQLCDAEAGTGFSTEAMIHTARCARLLPGEGNIDLSGLMAVLPTSLPISVEVVNFEREQHETPTQWAQRCRAAALPYVM